MDNQQKTLAQVVQENVEREVRVLIGDLYIQIIQLKLMIQMGQQQEPAPQPQPAQPQPPVSPPAPPPISPQPEGEPPLDRPERRGNGKAREVAS